MKHRKGFYIVCAFIIVATLGILAFIVCGALEVINISTGMWITTFIVLAIMLALNFCCWCILDAFYNDWRKIKKNERWR